MHKPEIVAPAGDFEKLQMAIAYGADAVYVGGKQFSLRANAKNFDVGELAEAVRYAHERNVKVYVSANIFAHNADFAVLEGYLRAVKDAGVDAVIVADTGAFDVARQIEGLSVHISTQANVTNYQSATFYKKLGARRAVLARELSLAEIAEINQVCQSPVFDTEVFVHGAMCMSYSGRCLLSNYMTGRDANRGDCAQACRWQYHLMEEQRPGEYMPVYEDERGTHIFNSKDLCMIEHIPALVGAGISALKIEGRAKSAYYVAMVTRVYREALDDLFVSESLYESKKAYYLSELKKTGTRDFYTGFYLGHQTVGQTLTCDSYVATQEFAGVVVDYDAESQHAVVEQRNKFSIGDEVEFLTRTRSVGGNASFTQTVTEMHNEDGWPVTSAPHAKQVLRVKTERPVRKFDIMRRRV
ncbi:MAG: U32 family peptidase [Oscillospiraceae bacterium]|nr:U32 family peptidase [Oscillospiraceae bacterium]